MTEAEAEATITVAELDAIEEMDIPALRKMWDYSRNATRSVIALERLRHLGQVGPDGKPCVWGTVVERHDVGDFTILVSKKDQPYVGFAPNGVYRTIQPEEVAHARDYHVYVQGKNLDRSAGDLDTALLIAIAWKYEDLKDGDKQVRGTAANSQAVTFFKRMIGMS